MFKTKEKLVHRLQWWVGVGCVTRMNCGRGNPQAVGSPGTIHLAVVEARCVDEVILYRLYLVWTALAWFSLSSGICCCGLTVPTTTIAISHGSARRYSVNASVNTVNNERWTHFLFKDTKGSFNNYARVLYRLIDVHNTTVVVLVFLESVSPKQQSDVVDGSSREVTTDRHLDEKVICRVPWISTGLYCPSSHHKRGLVTSES